MYYPITIMEEDGGFLITLHHPDGRFQGVAWSETKDSVEDEALHLVSAVIAAAMKDGDPVPLPQECGRGNGSVFIPPLLATKVQIYQAMQEQGKRKADIARFMQVNQRQIDRILTPSHRSTIAQLEAAAAALGKHIEVHVS